MANVQWRKCNEIGINPNITLFSFTKPVWGDNNSLIPGPQLNIESFQRNHYLKQMCSSKDKRRLEVFFC